MSDLRFCSLKDEKGGQCNSCVDYSVPTGSVMVSAGLKIFLRLPRDHRFKSQCRLDGHIYGYNSFKLLWIYIFYVYRMIKSEKKINFLI